jgi:hypothetical protein
VPIFVLSLTIACFLSLVSLRYQLASCFGVEVFPEKRPEVAMQWVDPLVSTGSARRPRHCVAFFFVSMLSVCRFEINSSRALFVRVLV